MPDEGLLFGRSIQRKINALAFLLAFPALVFLGNSITFYMFIILVINVGPFWKKKFKRSLLFYAFLSVVIISSFAAPYSQFIEHPGFLKTLQMTIQFIYWVMLALFFIQNRNRINMLEVSKWVFYGTICAIIGFYLLSFKFGSGLFGISSTQSRNSFVFNLLCTIPLAFKYIQVTFSRNKKILLILFYLLALFLTNGRSGAIVGLIESTIIIMIVYPVWNSFLRIILVPMVILFIALQTDAMKVYTDSVADKVETINPRFAELIRGEGNGDLSMDKSWLIRKLMVDKGFEIVEKYPFIGIGPNNFVYYNSELKTMSQYRRLRSESERFYNTRSAHNSYIQILTEFGFLGLIPLLLILFFPISFFIRKLIRNQLSIEFLPIIALLGISIHFYAISSITGAIPWMVIGMAWAAMITDKSRVK